MTFDIDEALVSAFDFTDEIAVRATINTLGAYLASGFNDEEARHELGVPLDDYERLKKEYYARETQKLQRSSAHTIFIDYANGQLAVLKKLDDLMPKLEEGNQLSAAVGALRLASDVRHRIFEFGQDVGVLDKRPEEKRTLVITGSVEEMRSMVAKYVREIDSTMKSYGGAKGILDIDPGPTHRVPALAPPSTIGKGVPHHGRRVVKKAIRVS